MRSIAYLLLPLVLLATGCADPNTRVDETYESAINNQFIPTNYRAAEALIAQAQAQAQRSNIALVPDVPLIAATVVDINVLEKSSALGRTISELISARFTQQGYKMVEMKFRNAVYIKRSQGELLLTREIKDLAQSHNAQAVLVGTYSVSKDVVFVNLKMIKPGDNIVIAAHDYTLPLNATVRELLAR